MAAPFAFLPLPLAADTGHAPAASCPASTDTERARVVYIYDGDTVRLADGRRLRLVGINAPEMRPDSPAPEPFADAARDALQTLLATNGRTLHLQYDREHRDHYGRHLAHAFLDSGENIATHLLAAGLATTLVVPPNTWAQDCYRQVEQQARNARRGIWGHPRYQAVQSRTLPDSTRGFRLIRGRVTRLDLDGATAWLQLDGPLSVRIGRQDRLHFADGQLERLAGQAVEVRGWIRGRADGLVMTVRHPAALSPLNNEAR